MMFLSLIHIYFSSFIFGIPYINRPPIRSLRSNTVTLCPLLFNWSAAVSYTHLGRKRSSQPGGPWPYGVYKSALRKIWQKIYASSGSRTGHFYKWVTKPQNLSIAISAVLMYNKTLVYQVYTLGTEGAAWNGGIYENRDHEGIWRIAGF